MEEQSLFAQSSWAGKLNTEIIISLVAMQNQEANHIKADWLLILALAEELVATLVTYQQCLSLSPNSSMKDGHARAGSLFTPSRKLVL